MLQSSGDDDGGPPPFINCCFWVLMNDQWVSFILDVNPLVTIRYILHDILTLRLGLQFEHFLFMENLYRPLTHEHNEMHPIPNSILYDADVYIPIADQVIRFSRYFVIIIDEHLNTEVRHDS